MALAREAERHLGDFKPQELANTAWAFATLGQADAQLCMVLAREAGQRVGDLNPQGLANKTWAFATLGHVDAQLFMALAREAELKVAILARARPVMPDGQKCKDLPT